MTSSVQTRPFGAWLVVAAASLAVTAALVVITWVARRPSAVWATDSPIAHLTVATSVVAVEVGIAVAFFAGRAVLRRPSLPVLVAFAAGVCSVAFGATILIF